MGFPSETAPGSTFLWIDLFEKQRFCGPMMLSILNFFLYLYLMISTCPSWFMSLNHLYPPISGELVPKHQAVSLKCSPKSTEPDNFWYSEAIFDGYPALFLKFLRFFFHIHLRSRIPGRKAPCWWPRGRWVNVSVKMRSWNSLTWWWTTATRPETHKKHGLCIKLAIGPSNIDLAGYWYGKGLEDF